MSEQAKQRTDISQTLEDFERVMEDYFQVIPPDVDFFLLNKTTHWEYDDMNNTLTFHFEDEWYLDEFLDSVSHCPKLNYTFDQDVFDGVDRQNLTLTYIGRIGGLLG